MVLFLVSCRSSRVQEPAVTEQQSALPKGETEIVVFCSGPEYETSAGVFRANSMGQSMDMDVAKRKAMANARLELASSIETTVRGVTDNYVNSTSAGSDEQVESRYESLTREVVNQELRGIRVICERYTRTPEGNYKAYVAIEMSDEDLVQSYFQRLAQESPNTSVDSVRKVFNQQMQVQKTSPSTPSN